MATNTQSIHIDFKVSNFLYTFRHQKIIINIYNSAAKIYVIHNRYNLDINENENCCVVTCNGNATTYGEQYYTL